MLRTIVCLLLLLCAVIPGESRSRHRSRRSAQGTAFDYYLLTLSWSPEYCHGHPSDQQCTGSKHYGFVVHGLWPEYRSGGGPENCGNQPGLANPSSMLDIMPSLHLIQHEWTTHGTCSGLDANTYFGDIRKAFTATKIPAQFTNTSNQLTLSPSQIESAFQQSNPGLPQGGVLVSCPSNYLQAVEICLDKSMNRMVCPAPKDCHAQFIKVPPIQ
jgi:ribonuclease T2